MAINFIPNDPLALDDVSMSNKNPRPDRPANRAGFTFQGEAPEARYQPGTPEFLFWQCREGALAAVETWERLDEDLARWAVNRRRLRLRQDAGEDLNAYYDRRSLSFFHWTTGAKTTQSGASTDVVAHEAGHALLDAIRPDLWDSFYLETGAFHEAFGDCVAILTALAHRRSRERLIEISPSLWSEHFLEATAEDLSDGVRREIGASHPAAEPRHAFNFYNWSLPSTLPTSGGPRVLTSEIHSFGRVFSGCLYDLLGLLWNRQPSWDQSALREAADIAGRLLIAGTRVAPESPRFFQSVGRAMVLADEQLFGGAHRQDIHDAFAYHSVALGTSAMLAPTAALAGPQLRVAARAAKLSAATRRDLMQRIRAPKHPKIEVHAKAIAGQRVTEVVHRRAVSLSGVDPSLRGVVAVAAESMLVGRSAASAAVLGPLPQAAVTQDEVKGFVQMLLDNGLIDLGKKKVSALAAARASAGKPTHAVRKVRGKKVLTRVRFACRH
jgi:hypothetical protein